MQLFDDAFLFLGGGVAGIIQDGVDASLNLPDKLCVEIHREQLGTDFGILGFQLVTLAAISVEIGGVEMIGFHIAYGLAEKGKLGFVGLGVFGLGLVEALLGLVINRPVLLNIADVLDRVIELFYLLLVGGDLVKIWLQLINKIAEVIQRVDAESLHRGKRLGGKLHIKNRALLLAGVAPVGPALSADAVIGVEDAHEGGRLFFLDKQRGQLFPDADKPRFQRNDHALD